jgi:hypothetical protein
MNDSSLISSLSGRWLQASPLLIALAIGAPGCEVHTGGSSYAGDDGSLTIDWTLDDTDDPFACDDYGARTLEIIIYDEYESVESTIRPPCDSFEASIDLLDGVYSIDATLLDRSGTDVSTTLSIGDIDVYAGEDTPISIDFPQDSRR